MKTKIEKTLFFVKPDCNNPFIDKATALEIIAFLEDELKGDFKRVIRIRTGSLPEKFFRDFYRHLNKNWKKVLNDMSKEFAGGSLAVFIYEGPNIIERVKNIAGPIKYKDNIGKGTIREKFGNENMSYRTIVHASSKEEVEKDFHIIKKWNLIPAYL